MKFLTLIGLCLLTFPVMAHEVTSPFYLPEFGKFLSKTKADFAKRKIKDTPTKKDYQRSITEAVSVGIGGGWAAVLQGNLTWQKNFSRSAGYTFEIQRLWEKESFLTLFSASYQQTDNVDFSPRRSVKVEGRLGKELKTMTPYAHLAGDFPLNARKEFNAPVYLGGVGVFQKINSQMTLDSGLFLKYDKNIKERAYGLRAEWSYLITSWATFGLDASWQARGHAQNHAKTYSQSIGTALRLCF